MEIDLNNNILQLAKVIALFFALFHLLVGFVLVQRVSRINKILQTNKAGFITTLNIIYIVILVILIALIIVL